MNNHQYKYIFKYFYNFLLLCSNPNIIVENLKIKDGIYTNKKLDKESIYFSLNKNIVSCHNILIEDVNFIIFKKNNNSFLISISDLNKYLIEILNIIEKKENNLSISKINYYEKKLNFYSDIFNKIFDENIKTLSQLNTFFKNLNVMIKNKTDKFIFKISPYSFDDIFNLKKEIPNFVLKYSYKFKNELSHSKNIKNYSFLNYNDIISLSKNIEFYSTGIKTKIFEELNFIFLSKIQNFKNYCSPTYNLINNKNSFLNFILSYYDIEHLPDYLFNNNFSFIYYNKEQIYLKPQNIFFGKTNLKNYNVYIDIENQFNRKTRPIQFSDEQVDVFLTIKYENLTEKFPIMKKFLIFDYKNIKNFRVKLKDLNEYFIIKNILN